MSSWLITRRVAIAFNEPSIEPRPIVQRLLMSCSSLVLEWHSRLCTDAPLLFHSTPSNLRTRAVQRHLGPAPGCFAKGRFMGCVISRLGTRMKQVGIRGNSVSLNFSQQDGSNSELLRHQALRSQMPTVEEMPELDRDFQSVVSGLYFVGLASSNSFAPLCRFAYGANFTSKRLAWHLAEAR